MQKRPCKKNKARTQRSPTNQATRRQQAVTDGRNTICCLSALLPSPFFDRSFGSSLLLVSTKRQSDSGIVLVRHQVDIGRYRQVYARHDHHGGSRLHFPIGEIDDRVEQAVVAAEADRTGAAQELSFGQTDVDAAVHPQILADIPAVRQRRRIHHGSVGHKQAIVLVPFHLHHVVREGGLRQGLVLGADQYGLNGIGDRDVS